MTQPVEPLAPRRAATRRWRWVATAVVVVLVLVAAAAWFLLARPGLRDGEARGVDVSRRQGAIDWGAVAADGISFASVKSSEGGDLTDVRFTEN